MKKYILILLIILFIYTFCGKKNNEFVLNNQTIQHDSLSINEDSIYYTNWEYPSGRNIWKDIFKGDSGYIKKMDVLELLKTAGLNGAKNSEKSYIDFSRWDTVNDNRKMGKYYKDKHLGRYMVFIVNEAYARPNNQVLQVDADDTRILYRAYPSRNYNCCWSDNFDGFKKVGDNYYIRSCGTGSGYCGGYVQFFCNLDCVPEEEILESVFCWDPPSMAYHFFSTSKITPTSEGFIFNYRYKKNKLIEVDDSTSIEKPILLKNFTIEYILINNKWVAKDSTILKSLDIPFDK